MHALIHYEDVRVPAENLLGGEGQAFAIAQTRLGGGRVHHAMRTVATCQRALDLLCERVLSRETQGSLLARKQFIQGDIADSYAELPQFRLLVLYTAWEIDQVKDYRRTRKNIAAIKALTPKVVHDAVWRSMHAHGALGVSNEMPFGGMWMMAPDHERGGRAHRGPQGHGGPRGPEGLPALARACGPPPTCRPSARRPARSWPPTSSTSSATPEAGRCVPPAACSTARRPRSWWSRCPTRCRRRGRWWWTSPPPPSTSPTCCWWRTSTRSHIPVPFTVGSEFAGTVRSVGPGVERLSRSATG